MKPIVNGLKQEYAGRVGVRKLNISDPKTTKDRVKYKFRAQPYFVFLDAGGEVLSTWQGVNEKRVFEEAFAAHLDR